MRTPPHITEAEWEVMQVLWDQGPLTLPAVLGALSASTAWNPSTVRTLLGRLAHKGAVEVSGQRRSYRYAPRFSREECVRSETRSFVRRVYGGALQPMLLTFVQEERLSPEEIAELRRALEARD